MSAENNPRPTPDGNGPGSTPPRGPRLARPLAPGRSGAPTPARVLSRKAAEDTGFEVVDGTPAAPPPRKPRARLVDEETEVASRARTRTRTREDLLDDEEELPRKRRRQNEDDDLDEDRPRKKRKRRKKGGVEISDDANNVMLEWGGPVFLMVLGLGLGSAGSIGMAMKPDSGISPILSMVFFIIGNLIWVPIEIAGLVVIGKVFAIEYGDIISAFRNLAALGFLVSGLMVALSWVGLPWFAANPIIFLVGLGILIALFKLDVWEAVVTMFGLNLLSFVFNVLLFVVLIAMVLSSGRPDGGYDDDFDNEPTMNERFDPGEFDDGDDWDPDDPPPPPGFRGKGRGPGGPGNPNVPRGPRPPFPDDDWPS